VIVEAIYCGSAVDGELWLSPLRDLEPVLGARRAPGCVREHRLRY
jgi:hypothetical protein